MKREAGVEMAICEEQVKRLAEAWQLTSIRCNQELSQGMKGTAPTRLMESVGKYLRAHDPEKGKVFDRWMLRSFDFD